MAPGAFRFSFDSSILISPLAYPRSMFLGSDVATLELPEERVAPVSFLDGPLSLGSSRFVVASCAPARWAGLLAMTPNKTTPIASNCGSNFVIIFTSQLLGIFVE
jgi:hypothetical protein